MIGLMTVAALGLLAFQWYWISNALLLRNEQFGLKVTDALQAVVRTLEKQEIQILTKQLQNSERQREQLRAITTPQQTLANRKGRPKQPTPQYTNDANAEVPQLTDEVRTDALTPNVPLFSDVQKRLIQNFFKQQDQLEGQMGQFLRTHAQEQDLFELWMSDFEMRRNLSFQRPNEGQIRTDTLDDGMIVTYYVPQKKHSAKLEGKYFGRQNTTSKQKDETAASLKDLQSKSALLRDVVKNVFFQPRQIEGRVNRQMIDSLLKKAFGERGMNLSYDFAVQNAANQPLFCTASFPLNNNLKADLYKATLFPNDLTGNKSQLVVYFRDQRTFVFQDSILPVLSSLVLFLMILGCFYAAVMTILRQRKLADIKNDFINNMTHEFKTPISTITLAVEMAQEQTTATQPSSQKLARYLNIVKDETKRLGGHVEKVLQMALLDGGDVKLQIKKLNIHDIIEKSLHNMSVQIEQKNGIVELDFEAQNEQIEADELHLINILVNLIDNANKYSPDKPRITIQTRNVEAGVVVRVTDAGLGMTTDQLARIFDKFYRVPTGNLHNVKGFGLGLSYVKKMVELHHGIVEARSVMGQGSWFEIMLPFKHLNQS